jgi:hypothetical protein
MLGPVRRYTYHTGIPRFVLQSDPSLYSSSHSRCAAILHSDFGVFIPASVLSVPISLHISYKTRWVVTQRLWYVVSGRSSSLTESRGHTDDPESLAYGSTLWRIALLPEVRYQSEQYDNWKSHGEEECWWRMNPCGFVSAVPYLM